MKPVIALTFFVFFVYNCNSKPAKIQHSEVAKAIIDTTEAEKESKPIITKEFVLGKIDYKKDTTFIKVAKEHSAKEIYLQNEVYEAFVVMLKAAKNDSISFKIISGTRSFYEQKAIWNRKWVKYSKLEPIERAKHILKYSSMPSTSRHHWGTDLDLNSLNNTYFETGKGKKEYDWLTKNANSFGFYQVYTPKENGRTGYNLENWHWSYLPLANRYLAFYNNTIISGDVNGFEGDQLVEELNIITDYVNGINTVK